MSMLRGFTAFKHQFIALNKYISFLFSSYSLVKPHSTSAEYNAVEDIEFPKVPRAVSRKTNITVRYHHQLLL